MDSKRRIGGLGAVLWLLLASVGWAGGPRYVTGPPFFTGAAGKPVGWRQQQLMYFTDPGDLGANVNHAAADVLVAAAAGVWNVPVASITVGQGGELAEHVSWQDVYLSNSGLVWPSDVMSTNAAAIPVAVVYDTDGSVTDLLKGSGASDPSECEQNGVTETVDAFDPAGYILHAIVIVNGRCTGPAAAQQSQLQYQLERAFGRVLGLAWSQTNDNVFTGSPQPTYNQASYWPIMHPIDVLCGPYSYQCLPNPFTLRPDDIAGLVSIYPNKSAAGLGAGKTLSLADANSGYGFIEFPDNEGMGGVNVLMARETPYTSTPDGWASISAVTGRYFHFSGLSPFVAADTSAMGSMGTTATGWRGEFLMPYLPIEFNATFQNEVITTEPVNPLYIGSAAIGPWTVGAVAPSGSPPSAFQWQEGPGNNPTLTFAISTAPAACGNGLDGVAGFPAPAAASGWWNGQLCGYGHASYEALSVRGGRTLTIEVTALDANGDATTTKAMPVIGLFAPTDAAGSLPSLGVAPAAFQSMEMGTTTLAAQPFAAGGAGGVVTVGIADQRGEGRPDFVYQGRIFYADSVTPTAVAAGATGATAVTISGRGFRQGNTVLVNGVAATVTSWSSTAIVATVPSMAAAGATAGVGVDVEVMDLGTGATSTMTGALTYETGSLPNNMLLVSAPFGQQFVGSVASPAFAVQVLGSDGVTPLAGQSVVFSAPSGEASFAGCGGASCTVTTGANGIASVTVTPLQTGAISLLATDGTLTQSATFTGEAVPSAISTQDALPPTVPVGTVASTGWKVQVVNNRNQGIGGQSISFRTTQGAANLGPCNAPTCSVVTNTSGQAAVTVTPTALGPLTVVASDGSLSISQTITATTGTDILTLNQVPSATNTLGTSPNLQVQLTLPDGVTGVNNVPIVFSGPSSVSFLACGSNPCSVYTSSQGLAATRIKPNVAGSVTITASYGALSVSIALQFVAPGGPSWRIVSAPSGNVPVNSTPSTPFQAQLLNGSGNPMSGYQVIVGGPLDGLRVNACGLGSCEMTTDGNGEVTSTVTPTQAGPMVVEAVYLGLVAQASFTSVGGGASLTVVTPPPATVPVGSAVSFKLLAIGPDGVTPLPIATAWVSVTNGDFAIAGCKFTLCKTNTLADGTLTITGIPWAAGSTGVSVDVGELVANVSFMATNQLATAAPSQSYVAQGAVLTLPLQVTVTQNGSAAAGQAVAWTGSSGFSVGAAGGTTDSAGHATAQATLGPLGGSVSATVKGCAWTTVCATFTGTSVAPSAWQIAVTSGGNQSATGGTALRPVVALVTDGLGDPLPGATVTIGQTVRALDANCPVAGRCPAGATLAAGTSTAVSDANGNVSVQPMVVNGVATTTSLDFTTGLNGSATAAVSSTP